MLLALTTLMNKVLIAITISNFKVLICYSGYDSCLLWTKCSQVPDDHHHEDDNDDADYDDDEEDAYDNYEDADNEEDAN